MQIGSWRISVERVQPTEAQLATMYNHAAWYWHPLVNVLGYQRAYQRVFDVLKPEIGLSDRNLRVLDSGVGTGAFSLALARAIGHNIQLDGVDISPEMLQKASVNFGQAGVSVRLQPANVLHLPFPSDTFGMALSAHMLEHTDNPRHALREIRRVMKVGAPLVLVVTRTGWIGSLIGMGWRNQSFAPDELLNILADAGFADLQLRNFGAPQRWASIIATGIKA